MKNLCFKKLFFIPSCLILSFFIQNSEAQWNRVNNGLNVNQYDNLLSMCKNINCLFIGTQFGYIYRSTNNGLNWFQCDSTGGLPIKTLCENNNNIFFGDCSGKGIYKSTNSGLTWFLCGLNGTTITCIYSENNDLFAGSYSDSIFISTNSGLSWIPTNCVRPIYSSSSITGITTIGNNLFASTYSYGVFFSTNRGLNWATVNNGLSTQIVFSLITNGNNLFVGTFYNYNQGGIFRSTNYGGNWVQIGLSNMDVNSLEKYQTNVFAGTNYGVYISKNDGYSWLTKNEGFDTIPNIYYLFATDTYLFALTRHNLWRRDLSDLLSIKKISNNITSEYILNQNFPNPFNPSTKIKFDLPKNEFVKITVFDMLGREIEKLVNEKQTAGLYEVTFDASKYPSGVYFYKLEAGDFSQVKKMILLK